MNSPINLIPKFDPEKEFEQEAQAANFPNSTLEEAQQFVDSANRFMDQLSDVIGDEDMKFGSRIDTLLSLNASLVPILLMELMPGKIINTDRTSLASQVVNMVKGLETSIYKKREVEAREEVDLNHPKFQKAMDWLVEGVLDSMTNLGISEEMRGNFIHDFSRRMAGFEEEANKKLKGRSFADIDSISNPLVKEFVNRNES